MRKAHLQKIAIVLLLTALFTIFAVSPAFAATTHTAAKTVSRTVSIPNSSDTVCFYRVTANPGLNERTGPGTNYAVVGSNLYGSIVPAYQNILAQGSGYTWRQLDDGNWSVATWLVKTSQVCVA